MKWKYYKENYGMEKYMIQIIILYVIGKKEKDLLKNTTAIMH